MGVVLRVLHLIKGLGPGGAERLIVSLAGCRSEDVKIDVAYLLPHKSQLVPELNAAGAATYLLAGSSGLADPRWPVRLVSLIRQEQPDVLHIHSPGLAAPARLVVRSLRHRPRVVSTEHNVWPSYGRLTRLANALTLPLGDARLAVSEDVRNSAWALVRDHIKVMVQGIPVDAVQRRQVERPAARRALGLGDDEILVATVANFREKKDYPTLLAAAAACAGEPRLRFVAIGQGPLEAEMRALHGRLELGERFRFLGYRADPAAVVAGADIFAMTSRHEGLPIALLEAMALGVPPVVSAAGGIPEVITDGLDGVLLPPGDPAAFTEAFLHLASAPTERAALGVAACRRAADFDIARTEIALEELYLRLLEARRADPPGEAERPM